MICQCGKPTAALYQGVCKECFDRKAPRKPQKKRGRPARRTPEEKAKKVLEWRLAHPRTEYFRERARKLYGTELGEFVVRLGELYAQRNNKPKWGKRSTAKVYTSKAFASLCVKRHEGSVIEEVKGE
jgi:hypothetical protein